MKYETKRAMEMLKNIAESKEDKPYLACRLNSAHGEMIELQRAPSNLFTAYQSGQNNGHPSDKDMFYIRELYKQGFINYGESGIYATTEGEKELKRYFSFLKWRWRVRKTARFIENHWLFILLLLLTIQTASSVILAMNSS